MKDDTINRRDAMKAIINKPAWHGSDGSWYHADDIKDALENVPSADRPQGEWIKHDDERDYCSRCKHIFKTRIITKQDKWTNCIDDLGYNFCPNCGRRMKGADDEVC